MYLRLRRGAECFVVDTGAGKVYANLRTADRISRIDVPPAEVGRRVLASARSYILHYARAIPGSVTLDGGFEVRGALTQAEQLELADGCEIAAERTALQLHMDFFDLDLDGWITLDENYRAWRGLGFGRLASSCKAVFSALFFGGLPHGLAINTSRFGRYRSSGIFAADGRLDRQELDACLAKFDQAHGRLDFDGVRALAHAGWVSRRQFESLFALCRRTNGGMEVVTKEQFTGLFDGSLLWRAASMTDHAGRRARWLQPAADLR